MSWSDWVQTVHTQPDEVPSILDRHLGFKLMDDSARSRAIIQAMQNRDGDLFFLEGEGENETLLVYQHGEEWHVRSWSGEFNEEDLALFLQYTSDLAKRVRNQRAGKKIGDYYSLRPLIYGGEYWLEKIASDEINRLSDLDDSRQLSVILITWRPGNSLFEFVESLRRGDRIGYFETHLGVLLPFTGAEDTSSVTDRLRERFKTEEFKVWRWGKDFENHFELQTKVEEEL